MGDAHKRKINRGRIVCIGSAPVGKIARGISRVLYFSGRDSPHKAMFCPFGKASAIYPARRSPAGSSATYPPTRTGRPSVPYPDRNPGTEQHRCTWSCNPQSVRLPMSPPAPVGSYPTFSPLPGRFPRKETRGCGGYSLLRMHELTSVWQFHQCGALRCPDFPPLPVRLFGRRKQRQSPLACDSIWLRFRRRNLSTARAGTPARIAGISKVNGNYIRFLCKPDFQLIPV